MQTRSDLEEKVLSYHQDFLKKILKKSFCNLLITGFSGTKEVAFFLARSVLCLSPKEGQACDECTSCQQIQQGNHVDFWHVFADEKNVIRVEDFAFLEQQTRFAPIGGKARVVLIENADRITAIMMQKLLKILEEPPPKWIFLLTSSFPHQLPATILSRLLRIRLAFFLEEKTENFTFLLNPTSDFQQRVDQSAQSTQSLSCLFDQMEQAVLFLLKKKSPPQKKAHLLQVSDQINAKRRFLQFAVNKKLLAQSALTDWFIE
jgi:hypothetical protein